ncbi:right-handed parallel beta-helix repeat-containing protein [Salmonirosea aquatica]|uniref:right-handed parallel beta-helix repeat-containing protein n=1 Tax=Salmonirosea aquatica TaxID=2654236 RepID=UPI003570EBF9
MYNTSSSPTLTNCSFLNNSANEIGGGIFNDFGSNPTLTNCSFLNNSAYLGGGMCNFNSNSPTLTNCSFLNNSADRAGGAYTTLTVVAPRSLTALF